MSRKIKALTGKKADLTNGGMNWDFIVDTSALFVETYVNISQSSWMDLVDPVYNARWLISGAQSFLIKSFGIVMPHKFTLVDHNLSFSFDFFNNTELYNNMTFLDTFNLPGENYELEINKFVDMTSRLSNSGYFLIINANQTFKVSMVGVPEALNGLTFSIKPFVKVELQ